MYGSYGAGIVALREQFLWECSRLGDDPARSPLQRQVAKEKLARKHKRDCVDEWKAISAQMRSEAARTHIIF